MRALAADAADIETDLIRILRAGERIAGTAFSLLVAGDELSRFGGDPAVGTRRKHARSVRALLRKVAGLHGIEVATSGAIPCGAALLAANHVSYLDPIVIGSTLPCVPISKFDVSSWPVIGDFARRMGVLFVARGDGHSGMRVMREAARVFADQLAVLNFPEATTTAGDTVLPFRSGLFGLVLRLGVPVVPVSLSYRVEEAAWVGQASFLPHYLRLIGEERIHVRLHFGTALQPASYRSPMELAHVARLRVMEGLEEHGTAAIGG
jgi:1-acyl-sn-glycerol-3-phosphate acyltransferase